MVFSQEGIESESINIQQSTEAFWKKSFDTSSSEFKLLSKFMNKLIRIPQLLRSLDFRVMADIDLDELQSKMELNPRMADALAKIQFII